MRELQDLERFEMDTLNAMNQIRLLDSLYFVGDTMLRLCHNLNRYSTDLDFWMMSSLNPKTIFDKLYQKFSEKYTIKDAENKHHTLIFEIKSPLSVRNLIIEIRKDQADFEWERKIAFSKHTNMQIAVKGLSLNQMLKNKVQAFLSRKLIRDCFDIEFLLFRGVDFSIPKEQLSEMLTIINAFTDRDYKVTLGSVLESKDRQLYNKNRFQFLKKEIQKSLHTG